MPLTQAISVSNFDLTRYEFPDGLYVLRFVGIEDGPTFDSPTEPGGKRPTARWTFDVLDMGSGEQLTNADGDGIIVELLSGLRAGPRSVLQKISDAVAGRTVDFGREGGFPEQACVGRTIQAYCKKDENGRMRVSIDTVKPIGKAGGVVTAKQAPLPAAKPADHAKLVQQVKRLSAELHEADPEEWNAEKHKQLTDTADELDDESLKAYVAGFRKRLLDS